MNQGQFNNIPKDKEACGNELYTQTNSNLNKKKFLPKNAPNAQ